MEYKKNMKNMINMYNNRINQYEQNLRVDSNNISRRSSKIKLNK